MAFEEEVVAEVSEEVVEDTTEAVTEVAAEEVAREVEKPIAKKKPEPKTPVQKEASAVVEEVKVDRSVITLKSGAVIALGK